MTTLPAQAIALPALSSNSLGSYIQAVGRIPALTREQEIALFERYQQDEDLDAVRQITWSLSHVDSLGTGCRWRILSSKAMSVL